MAVGINKSISRVAETLVSRAHTSFWRCVRLEVNERTYRRLQEAPVTISVSRNMTRVHLSRNAPGPGIGGDDLVF